MGRKVLGHVWIVLTAVVSTHASTSKLALWLASLFHSPSVVPFAPGSLGSCARSPQSPTIVGSLGYKGTKIQLYSVPPFVASAAFALGCCWASDRLKMRGPFVILAALVSVIGYAMYRGSTDKHVRYAALFLQVMGAYTVAPLQSTWMRECLGSVLERMFALKGVSSGEVGLSYVSARAPMRRPCTPGQTGLRSSADLPCTGSDWAWRLPAPSECGTGASRRHVCSTAPARSWRSWCRAPNAVHRPERRRDCMTWPSTLFVAEALSFSGGNAKSRRGLGMSRRSRRLSPIPQQVGSTRRRVRCCCTCPNLPSLHAEDIPPVPVPSQTAWHITSGTPLPPAPGGR